MGDNLLTLVSVILAWKVFKSRKSFSVYLGFSQLHNYRRRLDISCDHCEHNLYLNVSKTSLVILAFVSLTVVRAGLLNAIDAFTVCSLALLATLQSLDGSSKMVPTSRLDILNSYL